MDGSGKWLDSRFSNHLECIELLKVNALLVENMPKPLDLRFSVLELIVVSEDLGAPRLSSRQDEPLGCDNAVVLIFGRRSMVRYGQMDGFSMVVRLNVVEGWWSPPFLFFLFFWIRVIFWNPCHFLCSPVKRGFFPRPEDFELVEMVNQVPWRLVDAKESVVNMCFRCTLFRIVSWSVWWRHFTRP